ncbi:MAG: HEXXH motif domain-containing protein [Streptosporangiaceae bacterium]
MITTHQLPDEAFTVLASGGSDPAVIQHLREAQRSKRLMLLHAVAAEAAGIDPGNPGIAAFQAGYELLTKVQQVDPGSLAWLFGLPHIGAWAHDCLEGKNRGLPPDFGYIAAAAAAAAVRAGIRFELDAPVRDGRILLPGLGYFHGIDRGSWVRLRSDSERLTIGTLTEAPCAGLVPDDGSGESIPYWHGTRMARAVAGGREWTVLLETADQHLNRFALPMSAPLTADEVASWLDCIQSAWEVLVQHHDWTADSIAAGVSVLVPLRAPNDAAMDSATTPAAFGAIATSLPPAPVIMAEILVHEFQHTKLCGLEDMMPFMEPCDARVYAPWRPDPRPAGGVLQGVYAHLGIARFWGAQWRVETDPDDIVRAQAIFERWRSTIEPATATLLRTGCLTPVGTRFVTILRDAGQQLESETASATVRALAGDVALDHWLTWQLRHAAIDSAAVGDLAAAYQRGEAFSGRALPEVRIEEETRKVESASHSRLLRMRFLEPRRYRELRDAGMPGISEADRFLAGGQASMAVQAYCDEISDAAEPLPCAWVGLALAINLLAPAPPLSAFATRLPLMFDVHACLLAQGIRTDPLELAAWLA